MTGGAHFGHYDVRVESSIQILWIPLHTDQTVLFAVIEPMTGSARSNDSLQLIGLDPNDFVHSFVAPQFQTLSAQFHRPSGHPQENQTCSLSLLISNYFI